jgi:hypothetical protein
LYDSNHARPTKEARAYDLARPIEEARALDVEIDSENTIIVHIPKGSLVEGKSCTICTDFTSCINLTALRKKGENWIKAKKADKVELRDWPSRASAKSPYKLRSKSKVQ